MRLTDPIYIRHVLPGKSIDECLSEGGVRVVFTLNGRETSPLNLDREDIRRIDALSFKLLKPVVVADQKHLILGELLAELRILDLEAIRV
jgi:hypothetical protein